MRERRQPRVRAERFAVRHTARVLGAAAVAAALLLGGCGAARPVASALTERVAVPLEPVLAYLKHTKMPVYLPGWVPPTRQSLYTRYYMLQVRASADSYYVSFNFTSKPTPVNVTRPFDMAQQLGFIRGGPAGSLDSAVPKGFDGGPPGAVVGMGKGVPIKLPDGHPATFYRMWGVRWSQDGWRFSVASDCPMATDTAIVMPLIRRILSATVHLVIRWVPKPPGNSFRRRTATTRA